MALRLAIENVTQLADGGPVSITVQGKRGLDIGRDQHLDWTLPDPNRFISGKHCEIRFEGDAFVLHDVSVNGTFINDSPNRMRGPHRLRDKDRILIGQYIIMVSLDAETGSDQSAPNTHPPVQANLWDSGEEAPAPIDPRELKLLGERTKKPDFLDWAVDVFDPSQPAPLKQGFSEPLEETGWLSAQQTVPPQIDPLPPRPEPSRVMQPGPHVSDNKEASPIATSAARPAFSSATADDSGQRFVQSFARAAGLRPEAIALQNAEELADLLGSLMKIAAADIKELLAARLEAKRQARSLNQTSMEAIDNNPLKFSPTAQDALKLMFGKPTRSYLSALPALHESFQDIKNHQKDVVSGMRQAVKLLIEDLDPEAIETAIEPERGLSRFTSSRKAKLWDAFVTRWRLKARQHEEGLLGAFMLYFSQCYDKSRKP